MKKDIQSFFIWSAGSDETLLAKCPESERIKHAGYGALVWIPAVVGFFSMTYAISTITDDPKCYWAAGLAWSFIVFNIDRFILSSSRKSLKTEPFKVDESVSQDSEKLSGAPKPSALLTYSSDLSKDVRSFAFFIRLGFAIFVGIIVAHPVAMLTFRSSIESELDKMHANEINSIESHFQSNTNSVYASEHNRYFARQDSLTRLIDAERAAIDAEATGGSIKNRTGNLLRDSTTHIYGRGSATIARENTLKNEQAELVAEKIGNQHYNAAIDTDMNQLKADNKALIAKIRNTKDYMARETALENLISQNSIVWFTFWFLIIFFIVLDILPVTLKTFTTIGKYDIIIHHERISRTAWAYYDEDICNDIELRYQDSLRKIAWEKNATNDFGTGLKTISSSRKAVLDAKAEEVSKGKAKLADLEREFTVMFGQSAPNTGNSVLSRPKPGPFVPVEKVEKAILWGGLGALLIGFRKKIAEFLMEILLHAGGHMVAASAIGLGLLAAVNFNLLDENLVERIHKYIG